MTQQNEYIVGVDKSVVIKVGIRIGCVPGGDDVQHVIDIDDAIARAIGAGLQDFVVALVGPASTDLVGVIPTQKCSRNRWISATGTIPGEGS